MTEEILTGKLDILNPGNLEALTSQAMSGMLSYLPKVIGAILALWIGFKIVNLIGKTIDAVLKKRKIDKTVESFIVSFLKNILKALVVVAAIGMLGVETSSFVAMFAAVGLAVGMALSGTLGILQVELWFFCLSPIRWETVSRQLDILVMCKMYRYLILFLKLLMQRLLLYQTLTLSEDVL